MFLVQLYKQTVCQKNFRGFDDLLTKIFKNLFAAEDEVEMILPECCTQRPATALTLHEQTHTAMACRLVK